ncbi:hypothetical protein AX16_003073 [Volvariella volvacea WC 439]|nr:hypothetical protein AX16_003073 [Volvariella volvacea WC 439]
MQSTNCDSLLNLPEELLNHIVSLVSADALLELACTCRRLNTISLYYYFKLFGICSPTTSASLYIRIPSNHRARNDLRALRIAFSLRHIKALTAHIVQFSDHVVIPNSLTHILDEFHALVERLDYIDHVQLRIEATSLQQVSRPTKRDMGQLSEAAEWGRSYGRLMNMLMKKSSDVTLSHEKMPFHSHHKSLSWPPIISLFQSLWSFIGNRSPRHSPFKISWSDQELEWLDEQGHSFTREDVRAISPTIDRCLKIRSLTLCEELMLLPPCINWLPLIFKHSHLTHLKLQNIVIDHGAWGAVFSSISPALTQLQHFGIQRCWTPAPPLIRLLEDFSDLQSLEIGPEVYEPDTALPFFLPSSFPHLTHLAAGARWLLYLLGIEEDDVESYILPDDPEYSNSFNSQCTPKPMLLPSLTTLVILWEGRIRYSSTALPNSLRAPSIIWTLHSILQPRRPTFQYLGFRFFKYEFGRIGLEPIADQISPGTPINKLDVPEYGLLDVVRLQLWESDMQKLMENKKLLELWLSCFRSLKIVELVCRSFPLMRSSADCTPLVMAIKEIFSMLHGGRGVDVLLLDEVVF